MSDQVWWCLSKGHEPRIESLAYCRWTVASGDGGPKPGHDPCGWRLLVDPVRTLIVEKGEVDVPALKAALAFYENFPGREGFIEQYLTIESAACLVLDALKVAYDSQAAKESK